MRIELKKLNILRLACSLFIPIVLVNIINVTNSLLQNTNSYANYLFGIEMNWTVFVSIFSILFLCYSFWECELKNSSWEKFLSYPISHKKLFFVKNFILLTIFFMQFLLLYWLSTAAFLLLNIHAPRIAGEEYYNFLIKNPIHQFLVTIPSILISSLLVIKIKRVQILTSVALLITVLHILSRNLEYSVLNPYSWPYLYLQFTL